MWEVYMFGYQDYLCLQALKQEFAIATCIAYIDY